jgi:hypothetical protein
MRIIIALLIAVWALGFRWPACAASASPLYPKPRSA